MTLLLLSLLGCAKHEATASHSDDYKSDDHPASSPSYSSSREEEDTTSDTSTASSTGSQASDYPSSSLPDATVPMSSTGAAASRSTAPGAQDSSDRIQVSAVARVPAAGSTESKYGSAPLKVSVTLTGADQGPHVVQIKKGATCGFNTLGSNTMGGSATGVNPMGTDASGPMGTGDVATSGSAGMSSSGVGSGSTASGAYPAGGTMSHEGSATSGSTMDDGGMASSGGTMDNGSYNPGMGGTEIAKSTTVMADASGRAQVDIAVDRTNLGASLEPLLGSVVIVDNGKACGVVASAR